MRGEECWSWGNTRGTLEVFEERFNRFLGSLGGLGNRKDAKARRRTLGTVSERTLGLGGYLLALGSVRF